MRRFLQLMSAAIGISAAVSVAADFPQSIDIAGEKLPLSGKGTAYYALFVKVYDARLYANHPAWPAPTEPKCLALDYHLDLTRENLVEATEVVLAQQLGEKRLLQIKPQLSAVNAAYRDVGPGDSYMFCNSPRNGARLALNGRQLMEVDDYEFGEIYLGIWLGSQPISRRLRDALLGN